MISEINLFNLKLLSMAVVDGRGELFSSLYTSVVFVNLKWSIYHSFISMITFLKDLKCACSQFLPDILEQKSDKNPSSSYFLSNTRTISLFVNSGDIELFQQIYQSFEAVENFSFENQTIISLLFF